MTNVNDKKESERLIKEILIKVSSENGIFLDQSQKEYLSKIAFFHIYGFGFIDQLLLDEQIEEISIIGPNKPAYVFVRKKGWQKVNAVFCDEKTIGDVVNKMARSLGRHITIQNPRLDAMLPDGSRLHASLSPISCGEMTIRKFKEKPFSVSELAQSTISSDALAMLSIFMQGDNSILIAGNTASGKTTSMNALFSFVPKNERILITEETPEINIPHEQQLRLVANKEMNITLRDLVYDSLRMRPDRMIVGEVRNKEEAEALFEVILAGQARGSYATIHGQSVKETLARLKMFGINEMDLTSIDCIIIQRRMLEYDPKSRQSIECRKVTEIAEFDGEKFSIIYQNGKINKSKLIEKSAGIFNLTEKEMEEECIKRSQIISNGDKNYNEFFKKIQKELFNL